MKLRGTYIWAVSIAVLLGAWLFSGQVGKEPAQISPSIAETNRSDERIQTDTLPTRVRVSAQRAVERTRYATIRGKTENKRTVQVKAETMGRLVQRHVERGDAVVKGDLLCELSVEDRQVSLRESIEAVNQAAIDYRGAVELKAKGFNSDSAIASAKTRLATAEANLTRRRLALEKIRVRAPFNGFVENVHLELGDYVRSGDLCATVVDLDPMLIVGRATERVVGRLKVGEIAQTALPDGQVINGPISFVGQQGDAATRTYAVEIQIENSNWQLRSGITADIRIPVERVLAHKVSPALFSLDDVGRIGLRTVNDEDRVEFHLIDIVEEVEDGIWVAGLPLETRIITVGQELVVAGERVEPISRRLLSGNDRNPSATQKASVASF